MSHLLWATACSKACLPLRSLTSPLNQHKHTVRVCTCHGCYSMANSMETERCFDSSLYYSFTDTVIHTGPRSAVNI